MLQRARHRSAEGLGGSGLRGEPFTGPRSVGVASYVVLRLRLRELPAAPTISNRSPTQALHRHGCVNRDLAAHSSRGILEAPHTAAAAARTANARARAAQTLGSRALRAMRRLFGWSATTRSSSATPPTPATNATPPPAPAPPWTARDRDALTGALDAFEADERALCAPRLWREPGAVAREAVLRVFALGAGGRHRGARKAVAAAIGAGDPHAVLGAVAALLRARAPLVPLNRRDAVIRAATAEPVAGAFDILLEGLPKIQRAVLERLAVHLGRLVRRQRLNGASWRGLALVVTPLIFGRGVAANAAEALQAAVACERLLRAVNATQGGPKSPRKGHAAEAALREGLAREAAEATDARAALQREHATAAAALQEQHDAAAAARQKRYDDLRAPIRREVAVAHAPPVATAAVAHHRRRRAPPEAAVASTTPADRASGRLRRLRRAKEAASPSPDRAATTPAAGTRKPKKKEPSTQNMIATPDIVATPPPVTPDPAPVTPAPVQTPPPAPVHTLPTSSATKKRRGLRRCRVIHAFAAEHASELPVAEGDVVLVPAGDLAKWDEWVYARLGARAGYVPHRYVREASSHFHSGWRLRNR